jgi:hypothetical protein
LTLAQPVTRVSSVVILTRTEVKTAWGDLPSWGRVLAKLIFIAFLLWLVYIAVMLLLLQPWS